ncbi:hypothetical protein AB7008_15630 [Bradyrhizobium sp. 521_C7_N1_3]|uniref:aromatic-ring hydroxylase C-terminal domain-containing protein n=1 Tax=Bradyrhizobium TaxID=374 RepID=UPI003221F968
MGNIERPSTRRCDQQGQLLDQLPTRGAALLANNYPLDGSWSSRLSPIQRALFGLIRRDGYVAWAGERTLEGLRDLLVRWFGPPAVASGNM